MKAGKPEGSPEGDGGSTLSRTLETGGLGWRRKVGEGESEIRHRPGRCEGRYGEGWNAGGLPHAETGRGPEGSGAARREYEGRFY